MIEEPTREETTQKRGAGDRWLAGETVDGVRFAQHQTVLVRRGRFARRAGRIAVLLEVGSDPLYLVLLQGDGIGARVRQSDLEEG